MKNASIGTIPQGKGNGRGRRPVKGSGPHAAATRYMRRARATSKGTSNSP